MMKLNWICNDCTAAYSVDAPRCPQCSSTNYSNEGTAKPESGGKKDNRKA